MPNVHLAATAKFAAAVAALLLIGTGQADASGPGGGGGGGGGSGGTTAPLVLDGMWTGEISFPAPAQLVPAVMTLSQDLSGNLTGQLCTPLCALASGRVNADGSFEIRGETYDMKGALVGTTTCPDASVAIWIGGSVQERGGTGSFSFTGCAA